MENKFKTGSFAISKAGHDYNEIYIIIKSDSEYVYLSDGNLKTIDNPKKKKYKHIQQINIIDDNIKNKLTNGQLLINEDIKRAIKLYKRGCNN